MNTKEWGAEKGLSKDDLELWLEDAEANFGPLVSIEVAKGGTVATLNRDEASPATRATIVVNPGSAFKVPTGKKKVCTGRAYISGNEMKVLVYR